MNPDDFKKAWRAQTSQAQLTINADLLLKEVQRNRKVFAAMILWRDIREVGIALVMVPVWFYLGARWSSPWTWYLTVPVLLWIAGFMVADRLRYKRASPGGGEPLSRHVEMSLAQVEHQIWLLRNVLWWYLLPPTVTILVFFAQVAWRTHGGRWGIVPAVAGPGAAVVATYALVYWVNQRCVRRDLEPRRQELAALLNGLAAKRGDDTPRSGNTTWRSILWIALLFVLTGLLSAWAYHLGKAALFNAGDGPGASDPQVTSLLGERRDD